MRNTNTLAEFGSLSFLVVSIGLTAVVAVSGLYLGNLALWLTGMGLGFIPVGYALIEADRVSAGGRGKRRC